MNLSDQRAQEIAQCQPSQHEEVGLHPHDQCKTASTVVHICNSSGGGWQKYGDR